jgi:cytochrome b6
VDLLARRVDFNDLAAQHNISMPFFLWLDDRLALQEILEDVGSKFVPPHLGTFFPGRFGLRRPLPRSFWVRGGHGICLDLLLSTICLRSTGQRAIDHDRCSLRVAYSILLVCGIVLHVFRVYLTGGFKKPPRSHLDYRRGFGRLHGFIRGVTGYSLPYDQVGYWALRIVSGVLTDGPFHFYTGIDGWNGVDFWRTGQFDAILQPTPFCVATRDASSHARALFADSQTMNLGAALTWDFWAGRRLERRFEFVAAQIHFRSIELRPGFPAKSRLFSAGRRSLIRLNKKTTKTKIKSTQKTNKNRQRPKQQINTNYIYI